jgi:transposase
MGRQRSKRSYTAEFKSQALRRVRESGLPVTQVARELGVNVHVLRDWKRKAEQAGSSRPEAEASEDQTESEEMRRLRRELEIVRQERDFLKKAAAYFAKESR